MHVLLVLPCQPGLTARCFDPDRAPGAGPALLPPHWDLRLRDIRLGEVSETDWHWADLVIVSGMVLHRRDLARQITLAKAHGVPVAVAGAFATSSPGAFELVAADDLFRGEGEVSIPPFVEAIEAGHRFGVFAARG